MYFSQDMKAEALSQGVSVWTAALRSTKDLCPFWPIALRCSCAHLG